MTNYIYSTDINFTHNIDVNNATEVEFVHRQFPNLSDEQVLEAIKLKGPVRESIYAFLGKVDSGL